MQELVLFYHVDPRDQTQVVRLGSKYLYVLTHFTGPKKKEIFIDCIYFFYLFLEVTHALSMLVFAAVFSSLNKYFCLPYEELLCKIGHSHKYRFKTGRQHKGRPVRPEFSMDALKAGQMYCRH